VSFFRVRLVWFVATWLFVQLGTSAAAAVILHASPASSEETVCQCPGTTPGAMCPMHRNHGRDHDAKRDVDADQPDKQCAMRGTTTQSNVALLGWIASGAMPETMPSLPIPDLAGAFVPAEDPTAARLAVPDAPPPRR
jgi:hypothetical protein